jgi:hypothetical protein
MTKSISAALLLVLTVAAVSASAAEFTINVTFSDGGIGSGTFTTNANFASITSWNYTVSGASTPSHNFTSSTSSGDAIVATPPTPLGCPSGDAQELTFANAGFTSYSTICLKTALSASGATLDLPGTLDCDGSCGTATSGSIIPFTALISYAANLGVGDSHVNLTNAGSLSGSEGAGDICANAYVFDDGQELIACCSCLLTPNHLQYLSVKGDLVSNTLTPGIPTDVTVGLIATSAGSSDTCNPAQLSGHPDVDGQHYDVHTVPGLRAWGTTLHALPTTGYTVTETEFAFAPLSNSELGKMVQYCGFIQGDGSGYGICGSCTQGAAGANKAE